MADPSLRKENHQNSEKKILHMAMRKREIIIAGIVLLSLVFLFILGSARVLSHAVDTQFHTFLYFTICYLYINRISSTKGRILFAAMSLGVIMVVISAHFYLHPRRWEFVSRLIYCIDCVAILTFLLTYCTDNQTRTVLLTLFMTELMLLFINLADSEQSSRIFTVIASVITYVILSSFIVKKLCERGWKVAAVALFFVFTMVVGMILGFYWHDKETLFAMIATINTCISLVPWLWIMCYPKLKAWWKFYHEEELIEDEQYNFREMDGLPTRFTIKELERATENFQAPIGEGASGAVFKGSLADGTIVAVKRIKWQPSGETEFRTEMTIIATRQHVNLVRLLGFCLSTRGDRYLVYPFLENGSLDAWLFTDDIKRSHLTWELRFRIAIDVAKALAYLHHECHHRILHLDIKPANILLDGKFRALISDFGISKLIGKDESSVMTKARGTVGYLAPEMLVPNSISTKSDVYSYGMVLLELVGGRRNLTVAVDKENKQRSLYFPKIVREKMIHGNIMDVVDEILVNNEETKEEEVIVLTRLALWCIQENPTLRPNMIEVVDILEGRTPVHVPPESSMFVVNFLDVEPRCCISCQAREKKDTLMSTNALTISIQSGR